MLISKRGYEYFHHSSWSFSFYSCIQKNAKANIARDFYATERLQLRTVGGRHSTGPDSRRDSEVRELTPKLPATTNGSAGPSGRKMRTLHFFNRFTSDSQISSLFFFPLAAPMNLANSPYLHLLTPEEQVLCSTLRIIPRSYLTVKETLVREYARRGGKLRRREARDLVKIDVNKTSRIWDFLVQTGIMSVGIIDPTHSNQDAA